MSISQTTIWILFGGFDYEGSNAIAVLGTKEEAEALKTWGEQNLTGEVLPRVNFGFDTLHIEEWRIGERNDQIPKDAP